MRKSGAAATPWTHLDERGADLDVLDFLTTRVSALANALRRDLTTPYADDHNLSVSEWRVLSLIAFARTLPFSDLVIQSTSDKALVSRTVRLLQNRELVSVHQEKGTSRKRLLCSITPRGKSLHDKIIPVAKRAQAKALLVLSRSERESLFLALKKLQVYCDTELISDKPKLKRIPNRAGRNS